MRQLVACLVLMVAVLTATYCAYVTLANTEEKLPALLHSIEVHRTALSHYTAIMSIRTEDVPVNHSMAHTGFIPQLHHGFKFDVPATRPSDEIVRSHKYGGTRLQAGLCFRVGDYGLQSLHGQARVRVTSVGQLELVIESNVVIATWPQKPIAPIVPSPNWHVCVHLDGNLCLVDTKSERNRASCWLPTTHIDTSNPLGPHDGFVMRGIHQELCLERAGALDLCTSRFWHPTPSPDQRLAELMHQASSMAYRWLHVFGSITLAALTLCIYILVSNVLSSDTTPWSCEELKALARFAEYGEVNSDDETNVAWWSYRTFPDAECMRMSNLLGSAGHFTLQSTFCKLAADAHPMRRASLYVDAVMAYLFSFGKVTRNTLDQAFVLANTIYSKAAWEALGICALVHGHVGCAVRIFYRARSTKSWHLVLTEIEKMNIRKPVLLLDGDRVWCETYLDWLCDWTSLPVSDELFVRARKAVHSGKKCVDITAVPVSSSSVFTASDTLSPSFSASLLLTTPSGHCQSTPLLDETSDRRNHTMSPIKGEQVDVNRCSDEDDNDDDWLSVDTHDQVHKL
jgi:hypothetical protein